MSWGFICLFGFVFSCICPVAPVSFVKKIIYSILNCLHIFYWTSTERIWVDSCSIYFFHSFYYSLLLLSIFLLITLCCDNYSFIVSLEIRSYKSSCPPLFFQNCFCYSCSLTFLYTYYKESTHFYKNILLIFW